MQKIIDEDFLDKFNEKYKDQLHTENFSILDTFTEELNARSKDTFRNTLSSTTYYITEKDTAVSLKDRYGFLKRYVRDFNKLKKQEMIDAVNAVGKYLEQKHDELLDDEQKLFVTSLPYNHKRIAASAGSGKTHSILYRIKYLLENYTQPDKILVMTFNKDACNSLLTRVKKIFGFDIKLEIRTIDSFCASLYYNYRENGYQSISVSEYLIKAKEIMEKYGDIISNKYKFVFFDEFQDINAGQFSILKVFADNGCFLTVIGDDNQNIYQWRGSNNSYIINFDNIIPNCVTYKITTNYRSTKEIVNMANHCISFNKNKIDKVMRARNLDNVPIKPQLCLFKSKIHKFYHIINIVLDAVNKNKCMYDDIAILARNSQELKLFEEYLSKSNNEKHIKIPYVSLLSDDAGEGRPVVQKGHLTITTLHRSKGLEWKYVFIIGLCDKIFPTLVNDNPLNLEEERRLFYVGVTRAKSNLYFVGDVGELPVTRFIDEVKEYIEFDNRTNDSQTYNMDKIFWKNTDKFDKKSYSVSEIIKMINGDDITKMRAEKLIPEYELKTTKLFDEDLTFNEDIKKNYFEADFGEFCDRLQTRAVMLLNTKEPIYDPQCAAVIDCLSLTTEEMESFVMYKIEDIMAKCYGDPKKIMEHMYRIVEKEELHPTKKRGLLSIVDKIKKSIADKKETIGMCVRENTYPEPFLNTLKQSLINYRDHNKQNDEIMRDIYYVSLCGMFNSNRRRLVYRDVYDVFVKDFDSHKHRINQYTNIIKDNKNVCKIGVGTLLDLGGQCVKLVGEIDMIDTKNNTIVDFKCSDSTFKVEWLLQLLLYYSLHKSKKQGEYNNNKLKVFNILKGEEYEFEISKTYPHDKLLTFIKQIIIRDKKGEREDVNYEMVNYEKVNYEKVNYEKVNYGSISMDMLTTANKNAVQIEQKINEHIDHSLPLMEVDHSLSSTGHYIVLDTETTGTNINDDNIIQLAYIIYDKTKALVKVVDKKIKPTSALVSVDAFNVHKFSNDMLKKDGCDFVDVFKEFLRDMATVSYVVGHNVNFDINIIKNNLSRHNFKNIDPFVGKTIECTAKLGKTVCGLKNVLGFAKVPKLGELYYRLFNNKIIDAHDALADVIACAECYFKLKTKN